MSLVKFRGTRRPVASRDGFTLLEVLVATAVTLLMMVSLAQVFKVIGDSMKQGRAALELNSRLRNVAHRIQLDLNNCTVVPKPGNDAVTGSGYMKIYDGPLTDYSYANELASANRFGDVDDIIMFTARAGDDWFTGKVPLFVLQGVAPGSSAGDTELVTITAQHAEVVIFAEPLVTNELNPDRDPTYLALDAANNYAKLTNPATGAVTDLPSSYRLHYRTLLIRPDLNLSTGVNAGVLPNTIVSGPIGGVRWLEARPNQLTFKATTVNLPVPTCDMYMAHQQCDLSMRRVDPAAAPSALAANSLEDLANPASRFAHIQLPFLNSNFSMPVLALSPKLNMTYTLAEPGIVIDSTSAIADKNNPANNQSGFLHPAYVLMGDRTGEDVLASDVLAFDVKAFDQSAPSYELTTGELVTPNDPGYGYALSNSSILPVATGEFVDVGWGRKAQVHFQAPTYSALLPARLVGALSGVVSTSTVEPFSESLYKSGLAFQSANIPYPPAASTNLAIFQPSYDTWYARFEGDGNLQVELASPARGVARLNTGVAQALRDTWRIAAGAYVIDAGTDGIDNAGSSTGVDDLSERETSAPFPVDLRGVKISIRMEDPAARQFNQMSIIKEFVTQ